jgi:hypothetical protein
MRWQARITRDWRFYFRIEGSTYILLTLNRGGQGGKGKAMKVDLTGKIENTRLPRPKPFLPMLRLW